MIQVGDQVQAQLPLYFNVNEGTPYVRGTVFWVHPKGRFCRVRFELAGGPVNETFQIINGVLQDAEPVRKKGRG